MKLFGWIWANNPLHLGPQASGATQMREGYLPSPGKCGKHCFLKTMANVAAAGLLGKLCARPCRERPRLSIWARPRILSAIELAMTYSKVTVTVYKKYRRKRGRARVNSLHPTSRFLMDLPFLPGALRQIPLWSLRISRSLFRNFAATS